MRNGLDRNKPTLDEFLSYRTPNNAYIRYPGFKDLYIRKGDVLVRLDGYAHVCHNVIQVAHVTASRPGNGAFKALTADLVSRGKAIYVECVHTPWFQDKLLEWGFVRVNEKEGDHFLFNHVGHLDNARPLAPEPAQVQANGPR